jgi:hypothetical protein
MGWVGHVTVAVDGACFVMLLVAVFGCCVCCQVCWVDGKLHFMTAGDCVEAAGDLIDACEGLDGMGWAWMGSS